ncbi:hypothetical protein HOE31_03760 [bacterium]|jgi:hydrogenase/urease accessory protein HupE|nr:hypothetical protein [bacterium]MBT4122035.1 hypothetical protein [bacterium]MBT4335373.1 hypothetical protein [bacterium]MBT4495219.1 hypothetical protein [bacterium]MBT4763553.1 hypothetical protein [bacterium]
MKKIIFSLLLLLPTMVKAHTNINEVHDHFHRYLNHSVLGIEHIILLVALSLSLIVIYKKIVKN